MFLNKYGGYFECYFIERNDLSHNLHFDEDLTLLDIYTYSIWFDKSIPHLATWILEGQNSPHSWPRILIISVHHLHSHLWPYHLLFNTVSVSSIISQCISSISFPLGNPKVFRFTQFEDLYVYMKDLTLCFGNESVGSKFRCWLLLHAGFRVDRTHHCTMYTCHKLNANGIV